MTFSKQVVAMELSERAKKIEPSITMAISALAKTMKAEGKPVIGFGAGEPDFDTPEIIKQAAIDAIQAGKTKYTPATGIQELKVAICDKFNRDQQLAYTPEQIVVSCGAKHSLYTLFMALINPGDEVIVPAPYWVSYPDQVRMAEGVPVIVDTSEATQFKVTPELLEQAITPRTKVLILNSPSNPTGMLYSRDELEAIGEVVLNHGIVVISDEIYEKLVYGDADHISIASLSPELKASTVVVNGVAKAYSMTGWRIGYCAAPIEVAKAMGRIQSHSTSNPATPSQWASIIALNEGESDIDLMRVEFDKRRQYMVETLNAIDGVSCLEPEGAFYAFPNISGTFGKQSQGITIDSSATFCELLLKEASVACVPGSGFGADSCIRLSYAASMSDITEGLNRISQWVSSLT